MRTLKEKYQSVAKQNKTNELLQTTENSLEQKCDLCGEYANLELDNGNFICDTCAQIVGEKAYGLEKT